MLHRREGGTPHTLLVGHFFTAAVGTLIHQGSRTPSSETKAWHGMPSWCVSVGDCSQRARWSVRGGRLRGGGGMGCRDAPTSALSTWCRRRGWRNVSGRKQACWKSSFRSRYGRATNGRLCRAFATLRPIVGALRRRRQRAHTRSPRSPISISGWEIGKGHGPWLLPVWSARDTRAARGCRGLSEDGGRGDDSEA